MPTDSFSDMLNMDMVQDNIARPRTPLKEYGTQPPYPVIGRGNIVQNGVKKLIFMLNVSGTGKVYTQSDGGTFDLMAGAGNSFDHEAWAGFCHSQNRAYIYNGVDNLAYVDLATDTVEVYTALSTPAAPTATKTGMAGTSSNHYYKITALNNVGESIASTEDLEPSGKDRGSWVSGTDYFSLSWSSVPNATGYGIYYGTSADECKLITTTENTSWVDYGTAPVNIYRLAPETNSTQGAVFDYMHVEAKNSQLYGIEEGNRLRYSAPGTGDFSPSSGGGWVVVDEDGASTLNYVTSFRDGRGNPVLTLSGRGAAGLGKLFHMAFSEVAVGDVSITYPDVYQANGQSGSYSARGTVEQGDSLYYFTGLDVKSTGTSESIQNILTNNTISLGIEPDVERISLENLHKSVGLAVRDRIYWSLPVGTTENSEIWVLDLARKNAWILRWTVPAKDMWLYESSDGRTHHCVLVSDKILEFSRAGVQPHQDDGVGWKSRVAFESLVWDEDGIMMGKIRNQYFKLLEPRGEITANATGLTRRGAESNAGSDTFTANVTATGIGAWLYGGAFLSKDAAWKYGDDPGEVNSYGKSVAVLRIKPKGLVAQLDWEVIGETTGTDYTLSAVNTRGYALDNLVLKA